MRRCPCALFQMANEDSTAFTETEQDGKNIQCQSSGNGISMNGFFLLPHEKSQSSGNGISMNGFFLLPHEISSEPGIWDGWYAPFQQGIKISVVLTTGICQYDG